MSKKIKYILENYDYILITGVWGDPRKWKKAYYLLRTEQVEPTKQPVLLSIEKHLSKSSIAAIEKIIKDKISSDLPIKKLVFALDTLLLLNIDLVKKMCERNDCISRKDLFKRIYKLLYKEEDLKKDFDIRKEYQYQDFVRFIPGIISTKAISTKYGECVITWRCEPIYEILCGAIALNIYEKLKEMGKKSNKIAIIADTTHGINYAVTAFMKSLILGSNLYALETLFTSDNSLEELIILHYNSDPIDFDGASAQLHILQKIPIVKKVNNKITVDISPLRSYIENIFSLEQSIKKISNKLHSRWKDIDKKEWKKAFLCTLTLTRGLLHWSLRMALDIKTLPTLTLLKEALEEMKILFSYSKEESTYKINYHLNSKVPTLSIVLISIIVNCLKNYSKNYNINKLNIIMDKINKDINIIKQHSIHKVQATDKNKIKEVNLLEDTLNRIKHLIINREKYFCLDTSKIKTLAKAIYNEPQSSLILHEVGKFTEYLLEENKIKSETTINNIHISRLHKALVLVKPKEYSLLISLINSDIEKRNIYAHAGFAYGLDYFVFSIKNENKVYLALGDYSKIFTILQETTKDKDIN